METQRFACGGGSSVLTVGVHMTFVYKVILLLFIDIKGETSGRWAAGVGETPRHSRTVHCTSKCLTFLICTALQTCDGASLASDGKDVKIVHCGHYERIYCYGVSIYVLSFFRQQQVYPVSSKTCSSQSFL